MTEQEWLICNAPAPMLEVLRTSDKLAERKPGCLRLLAFGETDRYRWTSWRETPSR
jgi:hypothetical protein